jgi:two-component system CheB/CheR fusion protein
LGGFHFALNPGGILFLGKAEMLLTYQDLFASLDWKSRLFTRTPNASTRDRWTPIVQAPAFDPANHGMRTPRLQDLAFEALPMARLVLNAQGQVSMVTGKLRELFDVGPQDVGKPLQDLEISYRPVELRSLIDQAQREQKMVTRRNVERRVGENRSEYYDVSIMPLLNDKAILGTLVTFVDVTEGWYLRRQVEETNKKLEIAYEELQAAHEEQQTTNEELQSTNEELQTTNEELQSSNEELETMNEELHSSNEELRAMNDVLRQRTEELDGTNGVMDRVLGELRAAVLVVDAEGKIALWNHTAEETWGVRFEEVKGTDFFALDIGLDVPRLRDPVNLCIADGTPFHAEVSATNRRGRSIQCHISIEPQTASRGGGRRAVILMEIVDEPARSA